MLIIIQMKNFTVFYYRSKMMKQHMFLKKIHKNSFETYIGSFLQSFSIDDQEKFDLFAVKNSKYLFCCFNHFIKAFGNPRYKLLCTRKMLDSVGIKKNRRKKQTIFD